MITKSTDSAIKQEAYSVRLKRLHKTNENHVAGGRSLTHCLLFLFTTRSEYYIDKTKIKIIATTGLL